MSPAVQVAFDFMFASFACQEFSNVQVAPPAFGVREASALLAPQV
jgi:hypothetical protein